MVVAARSISLAAPLVPIPVAEDKVMVVPEMFSFPLPSSAVMSVMEPAVAVMLVVPDALAIFPRTTLEAPVIATAPPEAV